MRTDQRTDTARLRCALALAICFAGACGDDGPTAKADAAAADGGKGGNPGAGGASRGGSGGASGHSGAGAGGRGGGTAGRGTLDDDGGTAYPIDAGLKGPAGSVRGLVRGFDGADILRAVVSAGGVQVGATATGHFFAGGVPAGSTVSIFVRASGYSTAHAAIPVREGEVTPILLDVTKLTSEPIDDAAVAHESSFGAGALKHSLRWSAGALQTVYGTAPSSGVQFLSADLGARLAPVGLTASGASSPRALRAHAVVELGLQQPRAALVLTTPATLTLRLADVGTATPSLYRFDEGSGSFELLPGGTYDAATQTLSASVDRLGTFAAATLPGDRGCAGGRIVDAAGAAVPRAAVRYRDSGNREAGLAWTDADGRYCLGVSQGPSTVLEALGLSGGGLVKVGETPVASPLTAASCGGTGCSDAGTQTAVAHRVGCVRGKLSTLGVELPAQITAKSAAGSGSETSGPSAIGSAITGESFCLDVTEERTLEVSGSSKLRCGTSPALKLPTAAASCAEQNCVDLGELQCCTDRDWCNGGVDEDCDGRVDEGCICNSSCTDIHNKYTYATNHCCTASGACGFRYPTAAPVDHCFEFSADSHYNSNCPTAVVTIAGKQSSPVGCCRNDNQCGLTFENTCVLRSEMQYLANMSLAPVACVF